MEPRPGPRAAAAASSEEGEAAAELAGAGLEAGGALRGLASRARGPRRDTCWGFCLNQAPDPGAGHVGPGREPGAIGGRSAPAAPGSSASAGRGRSVADPGVRLCRLPADCLSCACLFHAYTRPYCQLFLSGVMNSANAQADPPTTW